MKHVLRTELLDYQTFSEQRARIEPVIIQKKGVRRLDHGIFSFLFENRDTVKFQIQEMMRVEKLVREADILHELETYNALLGDPFDLAVTMLIGIEDPQKRPKILTELRGIEGHLFVRLEDGEKIDAYFDKAQIGDERLSAVQFLRFPTGGRVPESIVLDFRAYGFELRFSDALKNALTADFSD